MMKKAPLILLTLIIAIFSGCTMSTSADEQAVAKASLVSPSKALPEAAALYAKREDPEQVRKALKVLDGARDPDKRNFEVENTFAMYSYFLGSRDSVSDEEAEKVLKEGLVAARITRRLEPNKPDGWFWAAAILGAQSKRAPITVGIPSVKKIRDGLTKALEIDPAYHAAAPYLGLGQLELNTRGMAGGSADKAVGYLEKGMQISKDNAYIYLYLAEAYFAVDRDEDAIKTINALRNLKPVPGFEPEYNEALSKAEKLLKEKTS